MSPFARLLSIIFGTSAILYLFTCVSFFPFYHTEKKIDHDKIVEYVLEEVNYELTYGDNNTDINLFVDKAIKDVLTKEEFH